MIVLLAIERAQDAAAHSGVDAILEAGDDVLPQRVVEGHRVAEDLLVIRAARQMDATARAGEFSAIAELELLGELAGFGLSSTMACQLAPLAA